MSSSALCDILHFMDSQGIKRVSVIGLGRMGHGIAQTFAMAGCQVRGFDVDAETRRQTPERIRVNLGVMADVGLFERQGIDTCVARLTVTDSLADAVAGAQFLVEAVSEDLAVKQQLFREIEPVVTDHAILASNSSTIAISQSGSVLRRPQRALVTHWFNPPQIVPTVEVVAGPKTEPEIVESTIQLHRYAGKMAVRVNKELPGFLVNRVQTALIREVWDLLEQGVASAADIDAAIRGSIGFRLAVGGPLEVCDYGGLDIWRTVYGTLVGQIHSGTQVPRVMEDLVAGGNLGSKTGRGFHDYNPSTLPQQQLQREANMLGLAKLLFGAEC